MRTAYTHSRHAVLDDRAYANQLVSHAAQTTPIATIPECHGTMGSCCEDCIPAQQEEQCMREAQPEVPSFPGRQDIAVSSLYPLA